jgi:hypothetical protein
MPTDDPLSDTVEQLRALALGATDASGYFAAMYARVTRQVADDVRDGRFRDPGGMVEFATAFAGYYLRAVERPGTAPRCWRGAFDVAGQRGLLIVQHLLLGMNAHVNHDLPLVVVDLADSRGGIAAMEEDFRTINDVLAATQPKVLHDLGRMARWVGMATWAGGDRVFNFSLTAARDQAWRSAVRLHGLEPGERPDDVAELDDLVAVLAYLVTRPSPPMGWLVPLGRLLEQRDPAVVSRQLLGPLR